MEFFTFIKDRFEDALWLIVLGWVFGIDWLFQYGLVGLAAAIVLLLLLIWLFVWLIRGIRGRLFLAFSLFFTITITSTSTIFAQKDTLRVGEALSAKVIHAAPAPAKPSQGDTLTNEERLKLEQIITKNVKENKK